MSASVKVSVRVRVKIRVMASVRIVVRVRVTQSRGGQGPYMAELLCECECKG